MARYIIRGNIRITTSRNKKRTLGSRVLTGTALAALAGSLIFAGRTLAVEYDVMRTKDASARQAGDLPGFQSVIDSPTPAGALPPRSALFRGIMRTRAAAEQPALAAPLLHQASADIDRARSTRPFWGEAEVASTYLALLRDGPASTSTRDALRRSYAAAPFLRGSAPWRIRYAASVWNLLDPVTRSRVVDETLWLARATDHTYSYARGLVANTPAAPLVESKLIASGN